MKISALNEGSYFYRRLSNTSYKDISFFWALLLFLVDIVSISSVTVAYSNFVSNMYGLFLFLVIYCLFYIFQLYSLRGDSPFSLLTQSILLFKSYFYAFILFCVFAFLTQAVGADPHRDLILLLFLTAVGLNYLLRLASVIMFKCLCAGRANRVLVIGEGRRAKHIAQEIKASNSEMEFSGFVYLRDKLESKADVQSIEFVGGLSEIDNHVQRLDVKHVIWAVDQLKPEEYIAVMEKVRSVSALTYIYCAEFTHMMRRYRSCSFSGCIVLPLTRSFEQPLGRMVRLMDVLASLFGLLVLSPIFMMTAIAIKMESRGPIFFVGKRIGRDGKPFNFLKFRSMKLRSINQEIDERRAGIDRVFNGDISLGDSTKVIQHNQITKIGRFIRKFSIDELPQLFSVLRGDMSLVGPRPPLPYEAALYKEWQFRRFHVQAGVSGLWQVLARSQCTNDEMIIIDLFYIEHRSILMNIEILIKTIPVVLSTKGAM